MKFTNYNNKLLYNLNYFKLFIKQSNQLMIPPQPPFQGNQAQDLKLEGLTRQQIKKIQKSMKKPEFLGLLNEYMIQISDPKNKTEYDQYLKQMQKEGQLPKHMKLVKLKPQFCVRTQIISDRNKKHEMKLFINMCSSQFIQKPSCQPGRTKEGGSGYNWKVPNSLGKIRYDQDKHKNPCQVIDCGFHPDTFIFSNQNSAFQAMIISIALQGTQRQLGQRKQTLSKDYIVLKNLKCKGQNGQPALLPIRYIDGKAYNRGQGPAEQQRNLQGKQTKLQKQINEQKSKFSSQQNQKKQQTKTKQQQQKQQDLDDDNKKKALIQDLETGIKAPKFTSIYTYVTDYSDFIDGLSSRKTRTLPNSFTVQFKVPRMQNISQANNLQINDKKIILGVQGKYYIDLSFQDMKVKSYPLKYSQAKAKFDKKKKVLRVQIPVDLAAIPQQELPKFRQPSQQQSKNENQQKIVENEVWKQKILQIPQQENASKFIAEQQVGNKQNKKLIQQIDEDDYLEQKSQQKEKQQIKQNEQDELQEKVDEQQQRESRIFKIGDYYEKSTQEHSIAQKRVQNLNCIIKQEENLVIVMIYMRNYDEKQIKLVFSPDIGQLLLLWSHKTVNLVHICLSKSYVQRLEKAELKRFVGYYAVIYTKSGKQKSNWGSQCIVNKYNQEQNRSVDYYERTIQKTTRQLEQKMKQEQVRLGQIQREKNTEQQHNKQEIQIKEKEESSQQKQTKAESQREKIDDRIQKPSSAAIEPDGNEKGEQRSVFNKLPVQYIRFNVPFIQTLN